MSERLWVDNPKLWADKPLEKQMGLLYAYVGEGFRLTHDDHRAIMGVLSAAYLRLMRSDRPTALEGLELPQPTEPHDDNRTTAAIDQEVS